MVRRLFKHLVADTRVYRKLRNRLLFPGLSLSEDARLEVAGQFIYGSGASISERARILIGKDSNFRVGESVHIGRECEIVPRSLVDIGDVTSIQDRCMIHGDVSIGRFCSLSLNVFISSGTHCFDLYPEMFMKDQDLIWVSRPELVMRYSKGIRIEDDCWLGINSVILPGTTIGKGAIVGANSVVSSDVPPYTVVAGAPARVIKRRLEFAPPKKLTSVSSHDLPYFYSGFALSNKEVEEGRRQGGILAGRRFQLMMDMEGVNGIILEIRSLTTAPCAIGFYEKSMKIGKEIATIQFSIDSEKPLEFTVLSEGRDRWPVCVASARVT
ncbi:MAG TPA: acyltransferase [Nitrospiraceae bacterium]|nr:acyltransferase [Nitrospiraceae bacterium]